MRGQWLSSHASILITTTGFIKISGNAQMFRLGKSIGDPGLELSIFAKVRVGTTWPTNLGQQILIIIYQED